MIDSLTLDIPDEWFNHVLDYSNEKGIGFEINGMRAWFKQFTSTGFILARFEYKNADTNRWKMFYRTVVHKEVLMYVIKLAQEKFLVGYSCLTNRS